MNKVEVKSNGIVIGHTYDEGKTIDFLDNEEAKKVIQKLNTTQIGISARKTGHVDENGYITEMNDLNELCVINNDAEQCYYCPKCKGYTYDVDYCDNPCCPNMPCCGKPRELCDCKETDVKKD